MSENHCHLTWRDSLLSADNCFNFAGNFRHFVEYIVKVFCELQQINFIAGRVIIMNLLSDSFMCRVV